MFLDSVRRQAHRAASHQSGNQNYNPFSRVLSRDAYTDEENQPHRSRSEAFVTPDLEQQRHLEGSAAGKEYGPPLHHNTEPSNASPTTALGSSSVPESSNEKGIASQPDGEKISSEDGTVVGSSRENSTGLTKRAKFKTLLRKEHENNDEEELQRVESEQLSMEERKRKAHKRKIPVGAQIKFVLFGAWINVLLLMVPVGFVVNYLHIGDVPVFVINFFAIIPLAAMLSTATEELALRVGETMGGLLNATFGYVGQCPPVTLKFTDTRQKRR
jgi:Ca2+:H+ antiporter